MKTFCIVVFALLLAQGNLLAGGIIPVSRWKTHPILVDGKDDDWEKPVNFYDDKHGLFFAIRNDSTTLYLNFTATDPDKIKGLMSGWSLGILTKNKKSKAKASLTFEASRNRSGGMHNRVDMDNKVNLQGQGAPPAHNENAMPRGEMSDETAEPQADNTQVLDYILGFRSFRASGFIFTHDEVPVQKSTGIRVRVGQSDPAGLLYEIAIPLNELYEDESVKLNEFVNMTITVNASGDADGDAGSRQPRGTAGSAPGSGGPGGMSGAGPGGGHGGGMPGRGMGGGMPGGQMPGGEMSAPGQGNGNSSSEKTVFKQKFQLSSHQ